MALVAVNFLAPGGGGPWLTSIHLAPLYTQADCAAQGTPHSCISSVWPCWPLGRPSVSCLCCRRLSQSSHEVFTAADMPLTTKALALWAGFSATSWEGHCGGGRVSQARSKTERLQLPVVRWLELGVTLMRTTPNA